MSFLFLPTPLNNIAQTGMLEKRFHQALTIRPGYRALARRYDVPGRIGGSHTFTKMGRLTPSTTALSGSTRQADFFNGMTAISGADEQYTVTLDEYAQFTQLNLSGNEITIADQFVENAYLIGEVGSHSLEWLGRNTIFNNYMGGDTRVINISSGPTTTTCQLDDIRGFQQALLNGTMTAVSSGNTLTAAETGTTPQTLTITGVVADPTNVSSAAVTGGISGVITFSTASAPTVGDRILASTASIIVRPNGKSTTKQLVGSDGVKLQNFLDAKKVLRKNNIRPLANGRYRVVLDDDGMNQLLADPRFQLQTQGRFDSRAIQEGEIPVVYGMEFYTTTEAFIQLKNSAPNSGDNVPTEIHRAIVVGDGGLIQGNFEELAATAARQSNDITDARMVGDLMMVTRRPIDVLGENITQAYKWIGGFYCPSDATTTSAQTPTAYPSNFKRIVTVEYGVG